MRKYKDHGWMMRLVVLLIISCVFFITQHVMSQAADSVSTGQQASQGIKKGRLTGVAVTASALYVGSMVGLYSLWYADYPQSSFHFINDCKEWYGIDKIGHATSSYWIGKIGYESLRWSGIDRKKAIWYGGTWGFVFLATVEVFDGFSSEWGASVCDIAANTAGTAIFIGQQLIWDKQPFVFKVSFHTTEYAKYRPDLLGETVIQQMLKDYNGQTYWLSGNISSFLPESSKFPRWLSVSFGYGADGMLGAYSNPDEHEGNPLPEYERYPQFYLSVDADLTKIRTRSETLRFLLNLIGFIKIPAPALEYNPHSGFTFHPIYF
jgi:hypothetical protein